MNRLKHLFVLTILGAVPCLNAQSHDMTAVIPFDFHAGEKVLPAGRYTVRQQGSILLLRTTEGAKGAALMTNATYSAGRSAPAQLVFHRYGDTYFLSVVWSQESPFGRELLLTKSERLIAKQAVSPQSQTILAKK